MNPTKRATIWLIVVAALCLAAIAACSGDADAKKPGAKLAPPVPCTSKNRMDVFIDEDNIMYECECQMLILKPLCAWQVIGGVDSPASRKFRKQFRHLKLIPVLTVRPQ